MTEIVAVKDAARRLGLSEGTVRRMVADRRVAPHWIPGAGRDVLAVDLAEVKAAGISPRAPRRYRPRL